MIQNPHPSIQPSSSDIKAINRPMVAKTLLIGKVADWYRLGDQDSLCLPYIINPFWYRRIHTKEIGQVKNKSGYGRVPLHPRLPVTSANINVINMGIVRHIRRGRHRKRVW